MFNYLVVILTSYGQCRTNGFSNLENARKYVEYERNCNHAEKAELYIYTHDGYVRMGWLPAETDNTET